MYLRVPSKKIGGVK